MSEDRRILHIDLDAFYCSVEELRDPTLKGKPFAVGGRPDQRGVVASCSYAARKFGVRSALPMSQAVKICKPLIIVRGRYADYSEASKKVMDYLREQTDQIEQISIDEAFLDITKLSTTSEMIAKSLQQHVNSKFGLPCSIGIAGNKLVAKMATDYGKIASGISGKPPNAIFVVPPGSEKSFLDPLPVDALWGVGPKTAEKLKEMNIKTIGDITRFSEQDLLKRFGKWGFAISQRARGIDDRPIVLKHVLKSVSQETTFSKDVSEESALVETIAKLSHRISKRMKKKNIQGTTIKIKVRRSDFSTVTRQITLNHPSNDQETISGTAVSLFKKEWKIGELVRLIGVGVSGLAPEQLNLWDHQLQAQESENQKRLNNVIQDLRQKYGNNVLHWGDDLSEDEQ